MKNKIFIGLNDEDKKQEILKYNDKKIVFISPKKDMIDLGEDVYYINYTELINYVHYNKLLQILSSEHIIVFNECLRCENSTLHANCMRLYANQAGCAIAFNYFPMYNSKKDFFTLVNITNGLKDKYMNKFTVNFEENIYIKKRKPTLNITNTSVTDEQMKSHKKNVEYTIDNFDFKKKPTTIITKLYKDIQKYKINKTTIPLNNIQFIDKLKKCEINYELTNLGVDKYVLGHKILILEEMEELYESLFEQKCVRNYKREN